MALEGLDGSALAEIPQAQPKRWKVKRKGVAVAVLSLDYFQAVLTCDGLRRFFVNFEHWCLRELL